MVKKKNPKRRKLQELPKRRNLRKKIPALSHMTVKFPWIEMRFLHDEVSVHLETLSWG